MFRHNEEACHQTTWERNFEAAIIHFEKYGNLRAPIDYITEDGFRLGIRIPMIRNFRAKERTSVAAPERIAKPEALGIHRDIFFDMWDEMYVEAQCYYQKFNDLNVPRGYIGSNGKRLDMWIQKQRREYDKLSAEQRNWKKTECVEIPVQNRHGKNGILN